MNITIPTLDMPDEVILLFFEEKGIDTEGKTQQELAELVGEAIADEQVARFKELEKRKKIQDVLEEE